MSKLIKLFILLYLLFLAGCSFDKKTGFWTKTKKITKAEKIENKIKEIFVKEEALRKEEEEYRKLDWAKLVTEMRAPAWVFDTRSVVQPIKVADAGLTLWRVGEGDG